MMFGLYLSVKNCEFFWKISKIYSENVVWSSNSLELPGIIWTKIDFSDVDFKIKL